MSIVQKHMYVRKHQRFRNIKFKKAGLRTSGEGHWFVYIKFKNNK